MKTIEMGLNTEPSWIYEEKVIERLTEEGDVTRIESYQKLVQHAKDLRDKIVETVERDGCCALNWSCTGATRFEIHSFQWSAAMPEYRFEIGRYSCKVYKK